MRRKPPVSIDRDEYEEALVSLTPTERTVVDLSVGGTRPAHIAITVGLSESQVYTLLRTPRCKAAAHLIRESFNESALNRSVELAERFVQVLLDCSNSDRPDSIRLEAAKIIQKAGLGIGIKGDGPATAIQINGVGGPTAPGVYILSHEEMLALPSGVLRKVLDRVEGLDPEDVPECATEETIIDVEPDKDLDPKLE